MRKQTPWGIADYAIEYAKGIISYETSSHGGIWLSAKRREKVKELYPDYPNWLNSYEWWEEDLDWCVPYVVFAVEIKASGKAYKFEENLEHAKRIITDRLQPRIDLVNI